MRTYKEWIGGLMAICDRDCEKCSRLNIKVDKLGYPWGYECLKYGDSVIRKNFKDVKEFPNYKSKWNRLYGGNM